MNDNVNISYFLVAGVILIAGAMVGYLYGTNETTTLMQPQIDSILQENATLKTTITSNDKMITSQKEFIEVRDKKLLEKDALLNIESTENATLKDIALTCYWSNSWANAYQITLEHFEGNDYALEYDYECELKANDNWDLMQK